MSSSWLSSACLTNWHPASPRCTLGFVFPNLRHCIIHLVENAAKTCFRQKYPCNPMYYTFSNCRVHFNISLHDHFITHNSFIWHEDGNVSTYLPRASIFQLKDIHGVVDSATIVVKLNISSQTLYSNLQMEEKPPWRSSLMLFISNVTEQCRLP